MDRGIPPARQLRRYTLLCVLLECFITTALSGVTFTGYSEVHRALAGSVLLTTGEHEYSRYGYLQLLQQRCADIIQPDITWCGGLTEVRGILIHCKQYPTKDLIAISL